MLTKTRKITIITSSVAVIALTVFYALAYPSHFLWLEQNRIFLNTPHWIMTYFDRPAWLGCLADDWLTQFFIYPWVGPLVLSLTIAASVALFAAGVSRILPSKASIPATVIFALLMVACSMPSSTSLSFFICIAGGSALGLGSIDLTIGNKFHLNLSPLLIPLSYWMFGFGAIATTLFVIILSIKSGCKRWIPTLILSLLLLFITPAALSYSAHPLPYKKALLYPGVASPTAPQFPFERQQQIADAYFFKDYERSKKLALKSENPTDFSAFYYYLASALQDSLPDNLLKYPVRNLGTLTTIGDSSPLPVINMMNDLYFELGDMTYAERAAMMRNVFSPRNRNSRMICRLAEVNLVSGDTLAALKYLGILDKTHAYSRWSRNHHPSGMTPAVESEIMRRRAFSNTKDNIRLGDNCRNIILELLESNPHNTIALDYLLCTDLLLKDMDTFKMDYDTYCMEKGSPRLKDLYQQALMIYLAGTDAPSEVWEKYICSPQTLQRFHQYSNRRGDPAFSDTYWYYFDRQ